MSKSRKGMDEAYILPHLNADFHYVVRRYADGHLTYNMERDGKLCFHSFQRVTKKEIRQKIKQSCEIIERIQNGESASQILERVYS